MISLAIDSCCHDCVHFRVEDVVNVVGDHILMCALRQKCWMKGQAYLTICDGDLSGLEGEE